MDFVFGRRALCGLNLCQLSIPLTSWLKVLWLVLGDVGNRLSSFSHVPFENQVVDRRYRVVPIVCNVPYCLLFLTCFNCRNLRDHVQIDGDRILTHIYTSVLPHFDLLVPRVLSYLTNRQSLLRILAQYFPYQVLASGAHEVRDGVLGVQDFLI